MQTSSSSSSVRNPLVPAAVRNTQFGHFKFPWEKGPLAKIFACKDMMTTALTPILQPGLDNVVSLDWKIAQKTKAETCIPSTVKAAGSSIFEKVVKQTDQADYATQRFHQKQLALLSTNISASAFGQNILDEADHSSVKTYAIEVLDATFAVKSPETWMKRYYAMKDYFGFCETIALP